MLLCSVYWCSGVIRSPLFCFLLVPALVCKLVVVTCSTAAACCHLQADLGLAGIVRPGDRHSKLVISGPDLIRSVLSRIAMMDFWLLRSALNCPLVVPIFPDLPPGCFDLPRTFVFWFPRSALLCFLVVAICFCLPSGCWLCLDLPLGC